MNIFLFDPNLKQNASYFKERDPKRFNKQIVESTQLFAAAMKHYYNISVLKADGTPYIVNRILHHPACKYLLINIRNHSWHCRYLEALLELSPTHSCGKSYRDAISQVSTHTYEEPDNYLCITNSDLSGLSDDASIFDKYKRHLDNKLNKR